MSSETPSRRDRGFTLIEMAVAIVVLGVGLAGVMLAYSQAARGSADPAMRLQMRAIAEEMLEEIELKPYNLPVGMADTTPSGCARDTWHDISAFDGYSTVAAQQICAVDGTAISALQGYAVTVAITVATLDGVAAAKRIVVSVTHGNESLAVVGWRTNYGS